MKMNDKLLVTGASGQFGRQVIDHLLQRPDVAPGRVIAVTRSPDKLSDLAARGVIVRHGDFDDASSLASAFRGAQRILLVSTDTLHPPGARLAQHLRGVDAAERAGVEHVVYTSMPEPIASPIVFAPDHAGTERALAKSRIPSWTVLRNHWYYENLLLALPSLLRIGEWYSAAGEGAVAHVARGDLALAAAVALAGMGSGKSTHTLSGPAAYTTAHMAELIGQRIGGSIRVVPVSSQELEQGLLAAGLPGFLAQVFASFDVNTADGRVGLVTDDLARLTGHEPQRFEDWLDANVQTIRRLAA
jgi:NAD(P)H dehydrogenase (quinone)